MRASRQRWSRRPPGWCKPARGSRVYVEPEWTGGLARYLLPASPRPFGRWFAAHVGDGRLLNATTVCLNGVWRTSRSRILQRPKAYYRHLAEQTNVGNLVEAAQYTEFAAGAIFGGGDPEVGPAESA